MQLKLVALIGVVLFKGAYSYHIHSAASSLIGCNPVPGECQGGTLIGEYDSMDLAICKEQCSAMDGCMYITLLPEENLCYMYADCSVVASDSCAGQCVSASIGCLCEESGQCQGDSIGISFPEDSAACSKTCSDSSECIWWSYDPLDSSCTLYATCTSLDISTCPECVSGENTCNALSNTRALFIAGGASLAGALDTVEIVLLDNLDLQCPPVPEMPEAIMSGAGSLHNGQPLVCGSKTCYIFNLGSWQWEAFDDLIYTREYAAGVQFGEDWFMSGGYQGGDETLLMSSTEILEGNSDNFEEGPTLPYPMGAHCVASVNQSHALFTGGGNTVNISASVALYDYPSNSWHQLPHTEIERYLHTCGIVRDETGRSTDLIVAGNFYYYTHSVEILNLDTLVWTFGKQTPHEVASASSVAFEDSFLIIGGIRLQNATEKILQYDANNPSDPWNTRPETLQQGRYYNPVVLSMSAQTLQCFA